MSKYTYIELTVHNIKHLYTLFLAVYNKSRPKNYFEAKCNTAYTGASYIGFFAFENNVPVGYYGIMPIVMSINKQAVLAGQSCDVMTHPLHRKKGLFVELGKRACEAAKKEGLHFLFGFPNQNSFPGITKHLGFTHIDTMNGYTFKFPDTIFKSLYRRMNLLRFKNKPGSIENLFLLQGYDGVIYDKNYIAYKSSFNPGTIISFNEHLFWTNQSNGLWIGAFAPLKSESFPRVLEKLAKITKASSVVFMVSPGTEADTLISTIMKPEKLFPVIVKDLSGSYKLNNLKFQFSDIDIF